jgi:hypothetical protein
LESTMVSPSANATDLRGRESMSAMIVFVWWCQGEIWARRCWLCFGNPT